MKEKLYIGNGPDTFLGGGGQLSREFIDNGEIGQILTGNFIFAFPGMQTCHPDPESWFKQGGGPVIDMGPYFLYNISKSSWTSNKCSCKRITIFQ